MDGGEITREQREEMFREFHGQQLRQQTKRLDQIHNYVAIWFWLSVAAAVFLLLIVATGG